MDAHQMLGNLLFVNICLTFLLSIWVLRGRLAGGLVLLHSL